MEPASPEISVSSTGNSDVIRFGILGCAHISRKNIRAMNMLKDVEAYAVASRSLAKAEAHAVATGMKPGSKCYGSYEELLEDPLVDVVYVPLPSGLHLEWVNKIAAKGKHVLLEKPVAMSIEEFDKMLEVCQQAGVQLMDGTMWMHNPRTSAMKSILKEKKAIGRPISVYAAFAAPLMNADFLKNNVRMQKDLDGLGALGDLLWYCVRAVLWTMDYELPKEVRARPHTVFNDQGVIVQCGADLFWENGTVSFVECSFNGGLRQTVEISGTTGLLTVMDFVLPSVETTSVFEIRRRSSNPHVYGHIVDIERHEVKTELPQEALMVNQMAQLARGLKNGTGVVDNHWPDIARKTQLVLNVIEESIKAGAITVAVQ
ncbi:hypothetical protein CBR_g34908 [Chara braunii]|uniref:Uncharacterized protein n=1 Tax=Chara braunii TaxID=69332 RepID=A0A388LJZ5_CHABU|nr:hypothetical protein CBR_g34908 [Chara braunii]|eukprot:GBG82532.1 hypothetical protein CBR_g34908 [Chara braunii]